MMIHDDPRFQDSKFRYLFRLRCSPSESLKGLSRNVGSSRLVRSRLGKDWPDKICKHLSRL